MESGWRIHFWGVRGSLPQTRSGCLKYGGNTVCTTVEQGGSLTVLDAGTGLVSFGEAMARRPQWKRLNILLSHVHIDHVMGLFSFQPFFSPDAEIHLYGGKGLQQYLTALVNPPYWPVGVGTFPAKLIFHELTPGDGFALDGLQVSTMAGNHPNGSIMYRLEGGGKSLTYTLDCEADGAVVPALTDFARGTDLLIWDAAYAPEDLRVGWGHSTWAGGIALSRAAKVRTVFMTHYNWDYTDSFLQQQEVRAAELCTGGVPEALYFAREGMEFVI